MKSAVIVVFTHKPTLEWFERISLDRCRKVFSGKYDVVLACPQTLDVEDYLEIFPGLEIRYFPPEHFGTIRAYNRLKYSLSFYQTFSAYQFLLTYELDSFVFRDELSEWCACQWSYIGAPWFENFYNAAADAPFYAVGNSGFSLRSVPDCMSVLSSRKKLYGLSGMLRDYRQAHVTGRRTIRRMMEQITFPRKFLHANQALSVNEDIFWGTMVPAKFPGFKVADIESASRFSFDGSPRRLFEICGKQLPFGCHKWHQLDPDFWRPIIESYGYHWH